MTEFAEFKCPHCGHKFKIHAQIEFVYLKSDDIHKAEEIKQAKKR